MDPLNYQDVVPSAPDPPPYFEKEPYSQQPPPAYGPENPAVPNQYQPYYAPYGAGPSQGPVVQPPPHSVYVIPVQPPQAPDYLNYSIFTMLCCLPLGIGAVIYSVRTRHANRMGNITKAHQNSRVARNLAHCALGIGIVLIKIIVVCIVASY